MSLCLQSCCGPNSSAAVTCLPDAGFLSNQAFQLQKYLIGFGSFSSRCLIHLSAGSYLQFTHKQASAVQLTSEPGN